MQHVLLCGCYFLYDIPSTLFVLFLCVKYSIEAFALPCLMCSYIFHFLLIETVTCLHISCHCFGEFIKYCSRPCKCISLFSSTWISIGCGSNEMYPYQECFHYLLYLHYRQCHCWQGCYASLHIDIVSWQSKA